MLSCELNEFGLSELFCEVCDEFGVFLECLLCDDVRSSLFEELVVALEYFVHFHVRADGVAFECVVRECLYFGDALGECASVFWVVEDAESHFLFDGVFVNVRDFGEHAGLVVVIFVFTFLCEYYFSDVSCFGENVHSHSHDFGAVFYAWEEGAVFAVDVEGDVFSFFDNVITSTFFGVRWHKYFLFLIRFILLIYSYISFCRAFFLALMRFVRVTVFKHLC